MFGIEVLCVASGKLAEPDAAHHPVAFQQTWPIRQQFGPAAFGEVMGWMGPVMLPFNIVGVQLLPWCFDRFGSYGPGLQILMVALAAAALGLAALRAPQPGSSEGAA